MGFFERFTGGSAREQAAKDMEAKKMDKMMKGQAAAEGSRAAMTEEAPAEKSVRRESKEYSGAEIQVNGLLAYYAEDPAIAEAFAADPATKASIRSELMARIEAGESEAAVTRAGADLLSKLVEMKTVVGTPIEEEQDKAA